MCQGLRDPGSRQGSGRTLESSDSGPGFRESGTQISRLKAGSFVEAGTGIPLNSESPSHGLTFHSPGTVAVGAGSSASGHSVARRLRHTLRLAVRDCQGLWAGTRDQGPASSWIGPGRGQSLVPVPSQVMITGSICVCSRRNASGPRRRPARSPEPEPVAKSQKNGPQTKF
jgi:hypothetical protein